MASVVQMTSLCVAIVAALITPSTGNYGNQNVVRYDTTVYLRCQDGGKVNARSRSLRYQWIIPAGDILPSLEKNESTNTSKSKLSLLQDGFILEIKNVDEADYGLYICLMFSKQTNGNEILGIIKHGLNVNILSGDTTDYPVKIQYGFVAGVIVLVVMGLICYNYDQNQERYDVVDKGEGARWCEMNPLSVKGEELPHISVTLAETCYDNTGFQKEENGKSEVNMRL